MLHVKHSDFFEDIDIPLSVCLTILIGGRGTGKSTAIEYLRHELDLAHREDFSDDDPGEIKNILDFSASFDAR